MSTLTANSDTIRLLRECGAAITMAIDSIKEVLTDVHDGELRNMLQKSKSHHEQLDHEAKELLNKYGDVGKDPPAIASGMSWLKTTVKLTVDPSDSTAADLITDGCDNGVKSLRKYLNQFPTANDDVKRLVERLIYEEETLQDSIKSYL
ncbi:MAG: hypothetical protein IIY78_08515 [Clostridia bacterium]|nr:hypothetical protein [Clostridia bacterium]